jgi:hypothetical protein
MILTTLVTYKVPLSLVEEGRYLHPIAKTILLTLFSFENNRTQLCFPSWPKICERAGLSRNKVWDGLAMLERFGHIQPVRDYQRSNSYDFLVPDFISPDKADADHWWRHERPSIQYRDKNTDNCPSKKRIPKYKLPRNTNEYDDEVPF